MIREAIVQALDNVFRELKNVELPAVADDAVLLEIGLDSLDFAILVTRLHDTLGFDPFTMSGEAFYPTTFGEFVRFYERFAPKK